MDSIYALASAPGRAGVQVVRLSGPQARIALERLCAPSVLPAPRVATLRDIFHPTTKGLIDKALVLWFPAPHSFTGEDVVEFHLHGGRAILNAIIEALRTLPKTRLAEPGEFTRRAFENGKLDLTEAEAIADLVDAETEAQRKQALRQMEGALGKIYAAWAEDLKRCLAMTEAAIDFSDEELPDDLEKKQENAVRVIAAAMEAHLADNQRGERLREGFTVVLLGAPNAGKSSLLNALVAREAAIVSPIAGTTRDVIEAELDLGGYPVMLADTAGLRESADAIESEGVRRACARAAHADLKILLVDGALWPTCDDATLALWDNNAVVVVNKADLLDEEKREQQGLTLQEKIGAASALFISTKTGEGLPNLTALLIAEIEKRFSVSASPALTRARHRAALEESLTHLQRALTATESALRAEDLRLAMRALGRITGRVDVEDLLDIIFKDFCIGK